MYSPLPDSNTTRIWHRSHVAELILFALACSLLFVKLGKGEYESWDESHIVYRAIVIEEHGVWLDQSDYALGGLYSTSHPPLGIWLMVASRAAFGDTEFATRMPAAFCGLLASIGMLVLMRRWVSANVALLLTAAFACGSNFLWNSRHAQLDSLLLATSIWTVTAYLHALERATLRSTLLAAALFAIALLSKFGWALYILPFVIAVTAASDRPGRWKQLALFLGLGGVLGSAWLIYMFFSNQAFAASLANWLTGLGTDASYEGSDQGLTYYVNQLLVACPFIVMMVRTVRGWKPASSGLTWLAVVMLVLQLAATKFPHFGLLMLPAAYVLVAQTIGRDARLRNWEVILLGLSVLWSLSTQLRLLARGHEFELIIPHLGIAGIFAAIVAGLYLFQRNRVDTRWLFLFTGMIFIAAATRVWSYEESTFADGARHIAAVLEQQEDIRKITLVHSGLPHDSLTPRLAVYTKGMTSNWVVGKTTEKLAWTDDLLVQQIASQSSEARAVILTREIDRFNVPSAAFKARYDSVVSLLASRFHRRDSLRSYDLFYN